MQQDSKVVLYIGISLDGYIATKDDDLDWLLNTSGDGDNGFDDFYASVDAIIMGRRTYDWILEHDGRAPYPDKQCYVYTTRQCASKDNICFTAERFEDLISNLKAEGKEKIWIVGGSEIIRQARSCSLIDEYYLQIVPVILGDGIPLFSGCISEELKLAGIKRYGEFAELHYVKQVL